MLTREEFQLIYEQGLADVWSLYPSHANLPPSPTWVTAYMAPVRCTFAITSNLCILAHRKENSG